MLVCNVSLLRRRAAIAAGLAEAAFALDSPGTGNVVFATLVDDPASVGDHADAYLGQIMREAASAADAVNVIFSYAAAVAEAASAADAVSAGAGYAGTVADAAAAADLVSGTVTHAATTWNPSDIATMTLSNANLTATATNAGGVRTIDSYGSSKYYWEIKVGNWVHTNTGAGIASATAGLSTVAATPAQAVIAYKSGNIWVNNANSGSTLGARASNDNIGIALDAAGKLIWLRVLPSGNWNGSGTANPATGTGGIGVSALTGNLFALFASGPALDAATINTGGTAFSGSVPSGFNPGLP